MYNPGPGASFQRRKTKDTNLLTLVEEYLAKNKEKSYVNMDDMVKTLQASSFHYSRLPKRAFAGQVKASYNKYIQMHTRNNDDDDEDDDDFAGPGRNTNVEPLQSYRESELLDKVSSDSDIEIVDEKGDDTLSSVSTSCTPSGKPSKYHHHEASSSGFVTSTNQNLNTSFNNSNSSGSNLRNNHHYQQNVSSEVRQRGVKRKHGLENNDNNNSYENSSSNLLNSNSNSDVSQQESLLDSRKSVKLTPTTLQSSSNVVSTNSTNKQSYGNSSGNVNISVKKSRKEIAVLQNPDITFNDFAGCEKVIEEICQLLLHLKHPEIYKTLGVTPPRGFLLHGPPGCGKTLLANAIAGETKLPMLKMAATELISGVSGESEGNIRNLFQQAVDIAPCIIFLDEIDSITPKRETAQREMERRIVAQMLACIDELGTKEKGHLVVLIGATNRLETIDSALRRAGRFDREISLGIPDEPAREKILRVICNTLRLEPNFNFNLLAKLTPGYVGADLQALAREAAINAISEIISHGSSTENKKDDNNIIIECSSSSQVIKAENSNPIIVTKETIDSKEDEKLNEDPLDTSMSSVPPTPEKQKQVNETELENGNEKEINAKENNEIKEEQEPENKKDEEPVASTSSTTPTLDENNESNENNKDPQTIIDETPSQSDEASTAPLPPLSNPEEEIQSKDEKQDAHEIITIDVDEKSNEASTSNNKKNNTDEDTMLVDIADDEDDGLYDNIMNKSSDTTTSNYERVSPGIIDVDDLDEQMDIVKEQTKTEPVSPPPPLVFPIHSAYKWIHDVSAPLSQQQLDQIFIEMRHFELALKYVQPSAKREGFATVPDTTWNDIGALKDIRDELQVSILGPVKYSAAFQALGINNPAGVLLCGPPGCGKTLLAKAVANEAGINFISVKGPELLNMYVGESERAVRQCFLRAKNSSPCVIFFDELDALCPRRSDGGDGNSTSRVVNQLLTEMDGMESRRGVFIMAATNRPDIIDPAILRPGRLDKILFVDLPKVEDRIDILKTITKKGEKPKLDNDVDLDEIATTCQNYTGADLAALVREASVAAFRELVLKPNIEANTEHDISKKDESDLKVSKRHFEAAFLKIKPSVSKKDLEKYAGMKEKYSQLN